MIEIFPLNADEARLVSQDYHRFSGSYAEILRKRLPTAKSVTFIEVGAKGVFPSGEQHHEITGQALKALETGERSFVILEGRLFIPFLAPEKAMILAMVEGADRLFLDKVSADWLDEVTGSAEREFLLLKEARCDPATGLLNLYNLHSLLAAEYRQVSLHLLLVEILPKRMSARHGLRHTQRCAARLRSFLHQDAWLHHIGNALFALVLPLGKKDAGSIEVESTLLAYLKREGCHRVHIGSSMSGADGNSGCGEATLLDQAWTALREAEKRGPFSFCAYSRLAHPENHPLPPPMTTTTRRLSMWAREQSVFSIALFRGRDRQVELPNLLAPMLHGQKWLKDGGELAVFLEGANGGTAEQWVEGVVRKLQESGRGKEVVVGLCSYPLAGFAKSEIFANCRKALYHASFLDEAEVVACDAISLNLSGDVYFGDGDLSRAVSEYRHGLRLDEKNVNLYNSLGVTLAMMNKLVAARSCFEKALQLDPDDIMALYNIGLVEQTAGRLQVAYEYLERAVSRFDLEAAETETLVDLRLQVGILAGDLGHHQRALEHLLLWKKMHAHGRHGGKVCYYLGRAYFWLGNMREAMMELQRALQFNEYDDRAMSLLGLVYLKAREGNDIALTLCRKSVEIEPGNDGYRHALAEVQIECGMYQEASENLHRLLARKPWRSKAQMLLGRCCLRQGEGRQAKRWFGKALLQPGLGDEHLAEASAGIA